MKVVLLDDSRSALAALDAALRCITDTEIFGFLHPEEALVFCKTNLVDLLLVDYRMPKLNGTEVVKKLREDPAYKLVPTIMITSETDPEILIDAIEAGVTEFIGKPFNAIELKARVRNLMALRKAQLELSAHANHLIEEVHEATKEIALREEEVIWRLARAIEYRDGDTGDHISRVAQISNLIATHLGLPSDRCRMIYLAAPLHDVGKIGIADSVLLKPGKLTSEEITEMRRHVEIGVGILGNGSSELLKISEKIAGGHHEKWDGSGYPRGISGAAIPLEARIVAVADVFEALCSERPYKKAWAPSEARDHIISESGKHFDPRCVNAFVHQWAAIEALMTSRVTTTAPPLEPELETIERRTLELAFPDQHH